MTRSSSISSRSRQSVVLLVAVHVGMMLNVFGSISIPFSRKAAGAATGGTNGEIRRRFMHGAVVSATGLTGGDGGSMPGTGRQLRHNYHRPSAFVVGTGTSGRRHRHPAQQPRRSVAASSAAFTTTTTSSAAMNFARSRPSATTLGGATCCAAATLFGLRTMSSMTSRTGMESSMSLRSSSVTSDSASTAESSTATVASHGSSKKQSLKDAMNVVHPSYDVMERVIVDEYGAFTTLYKHKKSGAQLLSVSSDDDNKVFGITLRTPPSDSTGVPHILEHSVLCGSRNYPTKDPFVYLLKSSLQTFLNAFTYPDRTCYVVASQNIKDFYNLINVYTDAVFYPRAVNDPMVHAQEGWHLELDNKNDPLTYKGVVYNEMKGVYSSPDSILPRYSQRSIFPDTVYGVESGGDPVVIPDLSFEQFADFHRQYYHPSNSRIYFSGDDDVYQRLELMDQYLSDFDVNEVKSSSSSSSSSSTNDKKVMGSSSSSRIEWQLKTFDQPKKQIEMYPCGKDQPETHSMIVNWLLNDKPMTPLEEITLGVLDHLLMGTTSSILRKTLMESGLGDAVTGGGVSDELLQATFGVGLKGVAADKVNDVEQLILSTLEKVANDGFDDDDIASSLNTIEFSLREFNTGSFPKGLSLMLGAMSKWIYDDSPTKALQFNQPLAELKDSISTSGSQIFQDMIQDLLVNNVHRCTVELRPSKTMEDEVLQDEVDRLANIKSSLSDTELDHIIAQTKKLKELQATEDPPEARATIPTLELADLTRETTEYPIDVNKNEIDSGIIVLRHELGSTSGIAYCTFALDLSSLSLDDAMLLPLFTDVIMETGAGQYDSVQLSRQIGTHTGGIDVSLLKTAVHPEGAGQGVSTSGEYMQTKLIIQGKATSDKTNELFSLFKLILTDARLDSQAKVVEILKETRSRLESRIQQAGHSMVNRRMNARYRVGGYIDEMMGGISYLETVKQLLQQAQDDWPTLLNRLEKIRNVILDDELCRDGMILDITGDKAVMDDIQPSVESFLNELPGKSDGKKLQNFYTEIHPWVTEAKKRMAEVTPIIDEGFVVPTQVSYVGKAGMLYNEGDEIQGSTSVISQFLRTGYLWDYVRVMGGAYGGFCTFSPFSGYFSMLSYRDPNLDKTLDIYDAASDALLEAANVMDTDPDVLSTSIIGTIGDMDGAISNDQKGYLSFQRWLTNESAEYRQKYRDEILNTKPDDFRKFAERLKSWKENGSVAVVSSKAAFDAAADAGKVIAVKEIY